MKKYLLIFCLFAQVFQVKSQTLPITGKPIVEIFSDFHYYLNKDTTANTTRTNGFSITRAYLGYNFQTNSNFSSTFILNVGNPSEPAPGSKQRRYAFFREASVSYVKDRLSMSLGMTATRATTFQQKFLGKRYIADNFESINGYSYVADLGFTLDYIISDVIKVDFTLMNGEGYSAMHIDNSLKTSAGINITPFEKAVIRIYGDIDRPEGVWQHTLIGFIGFMNETVTAGIEAAHKSNLDKVQGHHAWGYSGTCSVKVSEKTEVFGRYDYTTSSAFPICWNYKMDGQYATFGFQYSFNQFLRMALNYQGTYPYDDEVRNSNAIFINAHFRF